MKEIVLAAVLVTGLASAAASADKYPERWNYYSGSCLTDAATEQFIAALGESKAAGCTHILFAGSRGHRIPEAGPEYPKRVERVKAEAKKLGLTIIPAICSIGYSGRYFNVDSNLAAGIPVRDMPFVVAGDKAAPDPALALDVSDLRLENGRLRKTFTVKPFMYYRVTFTMTAAPRDRESVCMVTSSGGKRWNSRTNPTVEKVGDRYRLETVFNTLEATSINFQIDPSGGEVSDVKVEPAGMLLILRRNLIPLTVTSADGKTVYEEGRDFKPVSDPVVMKRPFPGDYFIDHPAPVIELTPGSRIRDGQTLLVSFWHHQRIYNDQDVISMQDPAVWPILEEEIRQVHRLWQAPGYMLGYDEIRVAGWEPTPDGKPVNPGDMLARHFRTEYDLVRKYAPGATLYTWSDMFTPFHNARPFTDKGYYYLVNGNWDGAWEGLPKDVVIMNWYSPDTKTVKFFADRGHRQVLCGYYDGKTTDKMKQNIDRWMKVSRGFPNVRGFMYTTWHNDYSRLAEYFKLVDTYEAWGK